MITWKISLEKEMSYYGETLEDIIHCTITSEELNVEFDDGFGGTRGTPFRAYTKNRIYFPVCYDWLEWIESLPLDPYVSEPACHFGGGQ